MPGRKCEQGQRHELRQPDQAEIEGALVDVVHLPADDDGGHLAAQAHRQQRHPEQREIPLPQGGGKVAPDLRLSGHGSVGYST